MLLDGRLNTQRLLAEPLRREHLPLYCRLFQNEQVMATLSDDGLPAAPEAIAHWLEQSVAHWERHGWGLWLLCDCGGQFVGRAGLRWTTVEGADEVELAYALMPEFWNLGLATEIARASVRLAFEQLGLAGIFAFTLPTNIASLRVMQKAGLRHERHFVHAGRPHLLFRMYRQDHERLRRDADGGSTGSQ
jgi:[ribosomal protein S5]-alanine N-acetyltransferase